MRSWHLTTGRSDQAVPVFPLTHSELTPGSGWPPQTSPTPSSVSLLTEAQGHLSSTQCLCYCFSQERKIFLCIYVFVIGKKERSIGLNPTLFIYFLSFLDPQAAEFHFHWQWKGSGLLSDLEERVHAHLCMECILSACSIRSWEISTYSRVNIHGEPEDETPREQVGKDVTPIFLTLQTLFNFPKQRIIRRGEACLLFHLEVFLQEGSTKCQFHLNLSKI